MPELGRLWLAVVGVAVGSLFAYGDEPSVSPALVVSFGLLAMASRRHPGVRAAGLVAVAFGATLISMGSRAPGAVEVLAQSAPRCRIAGVISERTPFGLVARVAAAQCTPGGGHVRPGSILIDGAGPPGAGFAGAGWLVPLPAAPRGHIPPYVGAAFEPVSFDLTADPSGIHALAHAIRRGLARATAPVKPPVAELLQGFVTGDTEGIPAYTVGAFRRSGLSHVLAVSGSNVAIVVGGILVATRRLALAVRLAAATGGLVVFVAIVGPEPSVLRAALVGGAALAALAAGMKTRPLHVLLFVTVLLLVGRPWLVYAPGLHLSLAATAGILLWTRPMIKRLSRLPKALAATVSVTLAAQAAVAPITIATFGELSLAAPLANALALPAVPPATILGMAAACASVIFPPLGRLLAAAAAPFATWVAFVAETCGQWAWAAVHLDEIWAAPAALPVLVIAHRSLKSLP